MRSMFLNTTRPVFAAEVGLGTAAAKAAARAAKKNGDKAPRAVYQPDPAKPAALSDEQIVAAYRTEANAVLSDKELVECVTAIAGAGETVEGERLDAIDELVEKKGIKDEPMEDLREALSAAETDGVAEEIAKKLSAATLSDIGDVVEADKKKRRGALVCLRDLAGDLGTKEEATTWFNACPSVLLQLPEPGTRKSKNTGGQNPDFTPVSYFSETTKTWKEKEVSFYDRMWAHTTTGKVQLSEKEAWKDASDPKAPSGKYADKRGDEKQLEKGTVGTEFTVSTKQIKDAVKIAQQMARIAEHCPNIKVEIKRERDPKTGKLTNMPHNAPRPITICNGDDIGSAEYVSVSTFNRYKPALATNEAGGTVVSLKATTKRAPATQDGADKEGLPDVEKASAWIGLLATQMSKADFTDLLKKRLADKDNRPLLKSLGDLYVELAVWYSPEGGLYRKDYDAYTDELAVIANKAAAQKLANAKAAGKA